MNVTSPKPFVERLFLQHHFKNADLFAWFYKHVLVTFPDGRMKVSGFCVQS